MQFKSSTPGFSVALCYHYVMISGIFAYDLRKKGFSLRKRTLIILYCVEKVKQT